MIEVLIYITRQTESGSLRDTAKPVGQVMKDINTDADWNEFVIFTKAELLQLNWVYCKNKGDSVTLYCRKYRTQQRALFGALKLSAQTV